MPGASPAPRPLAPIAITMGEPAGIGGDIVLKAWAARKTIALPDFFLIDAPGRLRALANRLGMSLQIAEISDPAEAHEVFATALPVLPIEQKGDLAAPVTPGVIEPENAASVIGAIEKAVALTFEGKAAGLVTNPIQKSALYDAGFSHPGHTEFLGHLCEKKTGVKAEPVMMLAIDGLRTVPVTVHTPLANVPAELTQERIEAVARITVKALGQDFAMGGPRLAIAGLNPHAGESGALGNEERDIILPAIEALKAEGLNVTGPHSVDTLFHSQARMHYDAVLAMYHDQALIPIKTLDFDGGVNITLGLPIIRTSPDHGSALDLAGTGRASAKSLINAIHMARFVADTHGRKEAA